MEFIPAERILDNNVDKVAVSEHEVDIIAAFILNPVQLANEAENANPGIESIWNDERARRNHLMEVIIFVVLHELDTSLMLTKFST